MPVLTTEDSRQVVIFKLKLTQQGAVSMRLVVPFIQPSSELILLY